MTNPKFLSFLKIVFTIGLCVIFGFIYGQFIRIFSGLLPLSSRWVYIVLAIPVFLPIFEYIRTEYQHRPKFTQLIKEIFFTFVAAMITVSILVNFQFGGDYTDYVMSFVGLALVILIANLLSFGIKKGLAKLGKQQLRR